MRAVEERFFEKVRVEKNGCWTWTAAKTRGYGRFSVAKRKQVIAHRWCYEFLVGPIPDGHQMDHLCRQHDCVNVDHLEPVTHRTNQIRGRTFSSLNSRKTHCKHGHEFNSENTGRTKKGGRYCKPCSRS